MIVQHNMAALNTNRQLGVTNTNLAKSTEKLSSGYRVNRAGDDAAGLSISEKMRGQIRGLEQASTNAQDGISLIQTAEGAMNEIHSVIQRMRELAVQGANDTNVYADRKAIADEMTELSGEIDRIANSTEFNTMKLLDGSFDGEDGENALTLQVGANKSNEDLAVAEQVITFNISDMRTTGENETMAAVGGLLEDTSALTGDAEDYNADGLNEAWQGAIKIMDDALNYVSESRSLLGAKQNRLEHTIANTDNTAENLQAAESRIRDVNMADEMVKYSKSSILQQAGQSMLAQANQQTQGVLSLLR
ncbi:MAG: flagellin [Lachnospiraceae bacterium]|nr:flagellin [Lachnospiraceae bacterium]